MMGFVRNIEALANKNNNFRQVLYTGKHSQLVLMSLRAEEEIGEEIHTLDQFFRVEQGTGEAVMDGQRTLIKAGFAVSCQRDADITSLTPDVSHSSSILFTPCQITEMGACIALEAKPN